MSDPGAIIPDWVPPPVWVLWVFLVYVFGTFAYWGGTVLNMWLFWPWGPRGTRAKRIEYLRQEAEKERQQQEIVNRWRQRLGKLPFKNEVLQLMQEHNRTPPPAFTDEDRKWLLPPGKGGVWPGYVYSAEELAEQAKAAKKYAEIVSAVRLAENDA